MRRSLPKACLALLLSLLPVCVAGVQEPAAQMLVKGPVIQNVETDCATLTWVTQKMTGKPGTVYHQLELSDLEAGTAYQIDMTDYGIDATVKFTTAPAGPDPFFFIVFGDTRTRHEVHQRVVDRILDEHPTFVLHTGDLVSNGHSASDWDRFFEIERHLLRNAVFYPMLGNHENEALEYSKYFAFPGGNGRRYSFNWGSAHFAMLDTSAGGGHTEDPDFLEQLQWLKKDLASSTKPLTFVSFHDPLITVMEGRRANADKLMEKIGPILREAGVTAVFGGHDHNYQHHLKDGLHQIVAGGGGAPLYDGEPIPDVTVAFAKTENYVRVRVNGNKAHVEAVDLDGKVLDSFDLVGRPNTP